MKSVIFKSTAFAIAVLAVAIFFGACGNNKKGKVLIDGKAYTVSIGEITNAGDYYQIMIQTEKEVTQKFQEATQAPFWLGVIKNGEFTSASGKAVFDKGVLLLVDVPEKFDKIIIYTPDRKSIIEFDGTTKQVLPPSSAEEIDNLIDSQNPELCKKFAGYTPLAPEQNKAGISFEIVRAQKASNTFSIIKYENKKVSSRERMVNEFTVRFFAVDADNPSKLLNVHLRGGRNMDNTEFFGTILFDGDVEAKYALIGFEELKKEESAEFETPSFFYIVELGNNFNQDNGTYKAIKSYCEKPYLAGDLFKGLNTGN